MALYLVCVILPIGLQLLILSASFASVVCGLVVSEETVNEHFYNVRLSSTQTTQLLYG